MQSFFMQTTKTDQTVWMQRLIGFFVGCTSKGTFVHIATHLFPKYCLVLFNFNPCCAE